VGVTTLRTTILLLALLWLAGSSRAASAAAPKRDVRTNPIIELVTMGTAPALFHRWGHATLCVVYENEPQRDVCYNYGAVFPKSKASLGWNFLRGTAKFMVILQHYENMLDIYRGEDRSVWVQWLPYTQAQVDQMVKRLENDLLEENRYYTYHHMWDNCATRLRDHIDKVAGGALRKGGDRGIGLTYRDLARRGLAGRPLLIVGTTLGFGRGLDQELTEWASMGHPDYLRAVVAKNLGAKPERIHARKGKPLPKNPGYGHGALVGLALLLGLGVALSRRQRRYERLAAISATVVLTFLGTVLWLMAIVSAVPELYLNEALLVFWPTDFLLLKLSDRRRQIYLRVRIGALAIVSILLVVGVLVQPLLTAVLIPTLTCLALSRLPLWPPAEDALAEEPPAEEPPTKRSKKRRSAKA
jgi:hypothetical protein